MFSDEHTILIVDDDEESLKAIKRALQKDYRVITSDKGKEAIKLFKKEVVDITITDLKMPDMDGMDVLEKAKEIDPEISVIMLTAYGTIENAVDAMKSGAVDYLLKPVDIFELRTRVKKAIQNKTLHREIEYLRAQVNKKYGFHSIVGNSQAMKEIYSQIVQIAPAKTNVLVLGESGTGKELVAKSIHHNSPRANKPFIPLNCSALPENLLESELFGFEKGSFTGATEKRLGKFEIAQGGTIFLDEVGEMTNAIQIKLLRVLDQKEIMRVGGSSTIKVDTRLITATNTDLEKAVEAKRFREDLYYRLKVVTINLPPLRERKEDIPLLVDTFLRQFNEENNKNIKGFKKEVIDLFIDYHWPGNVRELKNIVENMVVMSNKTILSLNDVPSSISKLKSKEKNVYLKIGSPLMEMEKELIRETLKEVNGNRTKTAKILKIGLRTLQRKIKSYNLD
ncbi:MAG: sigma-54 dependent transcriptional regulator [Thermodesulfobacteriota bacterium]|nr:sigma-54 dependent transcriptional regulator [Thermodesulfobacteriota bacterium]